MRAVFVASSVFKLSFRLSMRSDICLIESLKSISAVFTLKLCTFAKHGSPLSQRPNVKRGHPLVGQEVSPNTRTAYKENAHDIRGHLPLLLRLSEILAIFLTLKTIANAIFSNFVTKVRISFLIPTEFPIFVLTP